MSLVNTMKEQGTQNLSTQVRKNKGRVAQATAENKVAADYQLF